MKSNLIKIISVIILIVIVGAFFALKNSFFTSNTNATTINVRSSEHNDYEGSKLETMSFKNEKLAFEKATNVTISSPEEVNSFIPTNASFDLNFDDEVSEEYVENVFELKPHKELQYIKVSPTHYKLTTKDELDEDEIYNVIEKTTNGTKRWAFQTEKVFRVEYTYPANGEYLTETGTPEIRFNGSISKDTPLEKYVKIEPNINGKWEESFTYNYRFEPSKHFEPSQTYKVTVLKGLKDTNGIELKEDYEFSFNIQNVDDISANLSILNNYKPNTKIDLTLNLSMNMNKALSLKEANLKIIKLASKEEFVKAISGTKDLKSVNEYYLREAIFEQSLKDQITKIYNEEKSKSRYYYYDETPLDTNLQIAEEGYYIALLNINNNISSALFQVNESTATVSVLSGHNFMILYKGKDGKDNSVDVYINQEKLGTTAEDGLLYLEDFRNIIHNIDEEVNVVEFKNGATPFLCDISYQVSPNDTSENYLTSNAKYNNGYLYIDRNSYKPGETVHFWGYAKNRKINIDEATIKITSNWDDVLCEVPVKLDDAGAFSYEYEISDVNKESYVTAELYIGKNSVYTCGFEVKEYELKQYQIDVTAESTKYLDGDTATINISANTYDGTPLKNIEFYYSINGDYFYNDNLKEQNGTVTTDDNGNAVVKLPLKLSKKQTNILPENVRVTILNSIVDGEQETINLTVYPYKHYADGKVKYIVDENKYYFSFNEYLSLNNNEPANDKIKVTAKAYKTVRTVTGQRYNKYTKEMEDVVDYKEVAQPKFDKAFTVDISNGKGALEVANYSEDKNCYYRFYAYLITDTGKELAINYNGELYSFSYKTIFDEKEYEEIEYVDPIINPELTYTMRYDVNEKLKVGDEVNFYLQDNNGKRIKDYSKFEFYTLVVSTDGNKIYKNLNEKPHFTFTKEMGANCETYTILYDTLKTYSPSSNAMIYSDVVYSSSFIRYPGRNSSIRLCDDEISLKLNVEFDKEVYEPKEEAKIKIKVTDKSGKGVKAGVNLSAVDTAFIDKNGEVNSNIISSLINNYSIYTSNSSLKSNSRMATKGIASKEMAVNTAMAFDDSAMVEEAKVADTYEMDVAGAGDESSLRDDLRVTAFFESIVTDENGNATLTIKLPDNITEWSVKAQAISNNFEAKSEEKKIKVSKDFFVSLNHNDKYLKDEHFAFNIKSFSKVYNGKDVTYKVEILDSKDKVVEQSTIKSKAGEVLSYKLKNGIKNVGTYKIKVTGTCEKIKDIILEEIEITNSLLDSNIREDLIVNIGDKIAIVSPKGYLYILNEDVAKILPTLFELSYMYNANRNDTLVIRDEASRIINNLYNGNEFKYGGNYYFELTEKNNLFKVMKNSSEDPRFALRMLATHAILIDDESIFDKVEVRLGEFARLWAESSCDKVSLKDIKDAKEEFLGNSNNYKLEDGLYLALAFAEVGSFDDAIEIYNSLKNSITDKNENEFELKVILSIKLNLDEREELYKTYLQKELLPENENFIKLYYIQNALSKNFTPGEIVLSINGKEEVVEVRNIGLTRKLIKGSDNIKLVSKTDNLKFMIEQYKPVDFKNVPRKNYIISKTYSKTKSSLGELVEVTITIDNKKLYEDGKKYGLKVEDAIPNNMTFVEYLYGENVDGYLNRQDGQKLTINFWNPYDPKWNKTQTKSYLKYTVRVTNDGEQFESGTILERYNNEIIDGIK